MSLFLNNASFSIYTFNNTYRMEGVVKVLEDSPCPNIRECAPLYSTGVCGHLKDQQDTFFASDDLVAFCVKLQDKKLDKVEFKKRVKLLGAELYGTGRLKPDEREHVESEVRNEMSFESPVSTSYVECLLDITSKRLFIQAASINKQQRALIFIENMLHMEELKTRVLFSERVLNQLQSYDTTQQLFMFWLYQISYGQLSDNSPISVRVDNNMKFKSAKTNLSISGDLKNYGGLYEEIDGFKQLKSMKLSYFLEETDEEGEQIEYARYSYELKNDKMSIYNYKDSNYSPKSGGLTGVFERNTSLIDLLAHFDVLVDLFERWLGTIDPQEVLKKLHDVDQEQAA